MKIEEKLWPPEVEKRLNEIWTSDLVFDLAWSILKVDQDIIKKFHEDWSKTVASSGWIKFYRKVT